MLRFPNPGSDIRCLIRLFQSLFLELASAKSFSLDDMSKAMVMNNLAASCGRMGEEALERSTRDDRSRDPLYNQSKMYSELFRALGWITSAPDSRLNFRFTTLGAHVAFAGAAAEKLALDKFKYMKLHLVCFRKQNIRKIVNILPVIFGC